MLTRCGQFDIKRQGMIIDTISLGGNPDGNLCHVARRRSGGWKRKEVASRLRTAGHDVYTPTLIGVGERVHLASPAISLETHVADVIGIMRL